MIEISGTSNTLEDIMFKELFESFFLVLIAEMGDKSQLLAMTFAARYPVRKVLLGILIGAVLNDGLAVLLGSMVSAFLPIDTIQIIAGFAFIIFALWTLRRRWKTQVEAGSGPDSSTGLFFRRVWGQDPIDCHYSGFSSGLPSSHFSWDSYGYVFDWSPWDLYRKQIRG